MIVNISEKNQSFFWTPPKTASNLATMIFAKYDFFAFDTINNVKVSEDVKHFHSHTFFEGHENFSFILTIRNPYDQFFSRIGYDLDNMTKVKSYAENIYVNSFWHKKMLENLTMRKPDYIVRNENIMNDFLKIPFIRGSEFFSSGKLKHLIESRPNNNYYKKKVKIIDSDLADLIYYNNIPFFEYGGYEKNSWKK